MFIKYDGMRVASKCLICGAPIYSNGSAQGNAIPKAVYSCSCNKHPKKVTENRVGMIKHGS